jgi:hypothetical protein
VILEVIRVVLVAVRFAVPALFLLGFETLGLSWLAFSGDVSAVFRTRRIRHRSVCSLLSVGGMVRVLSCDVGYESMEAVSR